MKNFLVPVFLAIFGTTATPAFAGTQMHSLGVYNVGFEDEQKMTPVEGLWGVGFSLLSEPGKSGLRTSIAVFDTELEKVHFDYDYLQKNIDDYYKGRKIWLGKIEGAKWLGEIPFSRVQTKDGKSEGYRMGFKYILGEIPQIQYSYYLLCNERVFLLKALASVETEKKEFEKIDKVISEFKCARGENKIGHRTGSEIRDAWKNAKSTREGKLQAIDALREFLVEYETSHSEKSLNETDDRSALAPAKNDPVATFIQKYIFLAEAKADVSASCFYAGWPSTWRETSSGKLSCTRPEESRSCEAGGIACNPVIFGTICVEKGLEQSATQACRAEYKRNSTEHDSEITKAITDSPKALDELAAAADQLCASDPYRNANYGLCSSLYDRIAAIDPKSTRTTSMRDLPEPTEISQADYDKVSALATSQNQLLNEVCYADEARTTMHSTVKIKNGAVIDCESLREATLTNFKALDKINETNSKAVLTEGGKVCVTCGKDTEAKTSPVLGNTAVNFEKISEKAVNSCTAKEILSQNSVQCVSDLFCAVSPTVGWALSKLVPTHTKCDPIKDNCLVQAATGLFEALWSTVKGLGMIAGGIIQDAGKGLKNLGKGALNIFGASYEIEDASSYKTVQLAHTAGPFLDEFKKDKAGAVKKLFSGILDAVEHWVKNDVLCGKWSGVPHFSTCEEPSSAFECLSCKQKLNGTCTAIGYIASQYGTAILTGGLSAAAKAFSNTAFVAKMLTKATTLGAQVAEKYPLLAQGAQVAYDVSKAAVQGAAKAASTQTGKLVSLTTGSIKKTIALLEKVKILNKGIKIVKLTAEKTALVGKLNSKIIAQSNALGRNLFTRGSQIASEKLGNLQTALLVKKTAEEEALRSASKAVTKSENIVNKLEAKLTPEARGNVASLSTERVKLAELEKGYTPNSVTVEKTLEKEYKASSAAVENKANIIAEKEKEISSISEKLTKKYIGTGKPLGNKALDALKKKKALESEVESLKANQRGLTAKAVADKKALEAAQASKALAQERAAELEAQRQIVKDLEKKVGQHEKNIVTLDETKKQLAEAKKLKERAEIDLAANPRSPKPSKALKSSERVVLEKQAEFEKKTTELEASQNKFEIQNSALTPEARANLQALTKEEESLDVIRKEYTALKEETRKNVPLSAKSERKIIEKAQVKNASDIVKTNEEIRKLETKIRNGIPSGKDAFGKGNSITIEEIVTAKAQKLELEKKLAELKAASNSIGADLLEKQKIAKLAQDSFLAKSEALKNQEKIVADLKKNVGSNGKTASELEKARLNLERKSEEHARLQAELEKARKTRDAILEAETPVVSDAQKYAKAKKSLFEKEDAIAQNERVIAQREATLAKMEEKYGAISDAPEKPLLPISKPKPEYTAYLKAQKTMRETKNNVALLKTRTEALRKELVTARADLEKIAPLPVAKPQKPIAKSTTEMQIEVEIQRLKSLKESELTRNTELLAKKETDLKNLEAIHGPISDVAEKPLLPISKPKPEYIKYQETQKSMRTVRDEINSLKAKNKTLQDELAAPPKTAIEEVLTSETIRERELEIVKIENAITKKQRELYDLKKNFTHRSPNRKALGKREAERLDKELETEIAPLAAERERLTQLIADERARFPTTIKGKDPTSGKNPWILFVPGMWSHPAAPSPSPR